MPTIRTLHPGEAILQVPALKEPRDRLVDHRPPVPILPRIAVPIAASKVVEMIPHESMGEFRGIRVEGELVAFATSVKV